MTSDNVFRLLAVRPAEGADGTAGTRTVPVYRNRKRSTLARATAEQTDATELRALAAEFRDSEAFVDAVEDLPIDAPKLLAWLSGAADRPIDEVDLAGAAEELFGGCLEDVADDAVAAAGDRLADTVFARALLGEHARDGESDALTVLKGLRLFEATAAGEPLPDVTLGTYLSEFVPVLPGVDLAGDDAASAADDATDGSDDTPETDDAASTAADDRAAALTRAHEELSRAVAAGHVDWSTGDRPEPDDPDDRVTAALTTIERRLDDVLDGLDGSRDRSSEAVAVDAVTEALGFEDDAALLDAFGVETRSAFVDSFFGVEDGEPAVAAAADGTPRLTAEGLASLSEGTRALVAELAPDDAVDPFAVVETVEAELVGLDATPSDELLPRRLLALDGLTVDRDVLESIFADDAAADPPAEEPSFRSGVGDLLTVEQTLKAYELTEFAHAENVLAGERREREHRRLDVDEETFVEETETTTETERDLQSTERNELQTEAERTLRDEMEVEAGARISGSYGPAVEFSANLDTRFASSAERTRRKARSFSREVTERAAERATQRVRREQRTRQRREVEETNRHVVNNEDPANGHTRGIYRWLEKVYDAEVRSYGQRMLYDFTLPEPASYFLRNAVESPPEGAELVEPAEPTYEGRPLRPSDLTRANYTAYVAAYGVPEVPSPPPTFVTKSAFDRADRGEFTHYGRATKVELDDGYRAVGARVTLDHTFHTDKGHHARAWVGGRFYDFSDWAGSTYRAFGEPVADEVTVVAHLRWANSFALGVDVLCELSPGGFADWQGQVYDAVRTAYERQRADYEDAVAAHEVAGGVQVLGRNPESNRRVERDELKRLVVAELRGEPGDGPERADVVRFLESAFEWNNLLYVTYPYFWGSRARWDGALRLTDPDPEFASFLKAGAARVQVPVRPGFESAVAYYCEYGTVPGADDAPLPEDSPYVPIVEEIASNLGRMDDGVPYPEDAEPWEVRVPTSLVVVQDLAEIPAIDDVLTGEAVSLVPDEPTGNGTADGADDDGPAPGADATTPEDDGTADATTPSPDGTPAGPEVELDGAQ